MKILLISLDSQIGCGKSSRIQDIGDKLSLIDNVDVRIVANRDSGREPIDRDWAGGGRQCHTHTTVLVHIDALPGSARAM